MIPSIEECCRLMASYRMLDNIKDHSIMVARVAEFLAENLAQKGMDVALDLTVSAALLHDIGKTLCLNNDHNHALKGQEICLDHGLEQIGEIVAEHVILGQKAYPNQALSAKEVVYYSDKRVTHDQIVSLDDRLAYIIERYGKDNRLRAQAIEKNFQRCRAIEEAIFAHLDCNPEELKYIIPQFQGQVRPDCCASLEFEPHVLYASA